MRKSIEVAKAEAVSLYGDNQAALARALGVTRQAVYQMPDGPLREVHALKLRFVLQPKAFLSRKQLTLNFEPGISAVYATCREYVAARLHQQGRSQKAIAADMDYSPSDLSRKVAQNPNDSRRFTLDDLEKFIAVTGDTRPVLYLVDKYLARESVDDLRRRLADAQAALETAEAGRPEPQLSAASSVSTSTMRPESG